MRFQQNISILVKCRSRASKFHNIFFSTRNGTCFHCVFCIFPTLPLGKEDDVFQRQWLFVIQSVPAPALGHSKPLPPAPILPGLKLQRLTSCPYPRRQTFLVCLGPGFQRGGVFQEIRKISGKIRKVQGKLVGYPTLQSSYPELEENQLNKSLL